jgi:hypothetical protein
MAPPDITILRQRLSFSSIFPLSDVLLRLKVQRSCHNHVAGNPRRPEVTKVSLFRSSGDGGSMRSGWSVTQRAHRPSVSHHASLRTDRQLIFSTRPQIFGHALPRRVPTSVRHVLWPLFSQLPFVRCFYVQRQCEHLLSCVSFCLQIHQSAWSCSSEKSYERLSASRRISSRRISSPRVVLRRCVTKIVSPQRSLRERMHLLFDAKAILYRQSGREAFRQRAWRPDPRRDFDLFHRNRIRTREGSMCP